MEQYFVYLKLISSNILLYLQPIVSSNILLYLQLVVCSNILLYLQLKCWNILQHIFFVTCITAAIKMLGRRPNLSLEENNKDDLFGKTSKLFQKQKIQIDSSFDFTWPNPKRGSQQTLHPCSCLELEKLTLVVIKKIISHFELFIFI